MLSAELLGGPGDGLRIARAQFPPILVIPVAVYPPDFGSINDEPVDQPTLYTATYHRCRFSESRNLWIYVHGGPSPMCVTCEPGGGK